MGDVLICVFSCVIAGGENNRATFDSHCLSMKTLKTQNTSMTNGFFFS